MAQIGVIEIKVETFELDEAIVKAKILNEELEKAKSLINDLAGNKKAATLADVAAKAIEQLRRNIRY